MDWKMFATVFGTVFLAELGDKTQLATVLFASKGAASLWTIFIAASAALVLTSAIGVAAGALVSQYVNPKYLSTPPASASSRSAPGRSIRPS